jgi:hypothetical protein
LTTVNGCDSILVIDLTILQVDNGVTQNGIVLTANAVGAEYSWFNCATGVDVFGATNQSFTPVYNGTYAVVVLQNGCYDTSACFTVNSADLPDMDFTKFQVYPNPTTGVFTIQGVGLAGKELVILDLNGRSIRNEQLINDESVINISEYHRGVYILKIDESVIRIVLD